MHPTLSYLTVAPQAFANLQQTKKTSHQQATSKSFDQAPAVEFHAKDAASVVRDPGQWMAVGDNDDINFWKAISESFPPKGRDILPENQMFHVPFDANLHGFLFFSCLDITPTDPPFSPLYPENKFPTETHW
jgi:hypothetical protein